MKGLTPTLRKILTNSLWAAIPPWAALLVAFLTVVVTIVLHFWPSKPENPPMINDKVVVIQTNYKTLTDFPNTVASRTRILIDGKDEKDVRYYEYIFDYQGSRPVRTADFETSIHGSVPAYRKILAVQQSLEQSTQISIPTRIDKSGHTQRALEPQITCEIQTTDQRNFEIRPLLMNPNDWFRVEIYTAADTASSKALKTPREATSQGASALSSPSPGVSSLEITWSCRIAGVQCPADRDLDALLASLRQTSYSADPLGASISEYEGWPVYFIVLFTIVNLTLLVTLAKQTKLGRSRWTLQIILFAFAIFLSMAVSEMLADWLFHDVNLTAQPVVLLYIDIALFLVLVWWALSARRSSPEVLPSDDVHNS